MRRACLHSAWVLGVALALAGPAAGAVDGRSCLDAVERAAARHGVPAAILRAVALVESGTRRGGSHGPWPWTLNIAGKGSWFDSRVEALAAARAALEGGTRSVDLGCFQINHRWHGEAFASVDEMLDPEAGADYAARFLLRLFRETGDWLLAAGYYHSRTPAFAERYRRRVALVADMVPADAEERSRTAGGAARPASPRGEADARRHGAPRPEPLRAAGGVPLPAGWSWRGLALLPGTGVRPGGATALAEPASVATSRRADPSRPPASLFPAMTGGRRSPLVRAARAPLFPGSS